MTTETRLKDRYTDLIIQQLFRLTEECPVSLPDIQRILSGYQRYPDAAIPYMLAEVEALKGVYTALEHPSTDFPSYRRDTPLEYAVEPLDVVTEQDDTGDGTERIRKLYSLVTEELTGETFLSVNELRKKRLTLRTDYKVEEVAYLVGKMADNGLLEINPEGSTTRYRMCSGES